MAHVAVSGLGYAHPGGDLLFSDVSFRVSPGQHVGLVGRNGVGKSTLLKILAGVLAAGEGEHAVGGAIGYMPQDVGVGADERTVRELLLSLAPLGVRQAGESVLALEAQLEAGDPAAGMKLGEAIAACPGDTEAALAMLEETAAKLPRDLREVFWNEPRRRDVRAAVLRCAERGVRQRGGEDRARDRDARPRSHLP